MKIRILLYLLLFSSFNIVFSQDYSLESFPQNYQLFQRDSPKGTTFTVSGSVQTSVFQSVSLIIKKNNQLLSYRRVNLPINSDGKFNFSQEILAELSQYDVSLFGFKQKDSVLIKEAKNVVCGESIIFYGQSNLEAWESPPVVMMDNPFARTIVGNFDTYSFEWTPSIIDWGYHFAVGVVGIELQRLIIEKYKIPVAIINGSVGGQSIIQLNNRDSNYPQNTKTNYGKLYARMKYAELMNKSKIFVFRQGESEAWNGANYDYGQEFDKLYKMLKKDYSAIRTFYNFQIDMLATSAAAKAGSIREFQRKTRLLYPDIQTLASIGTIGYDGLHYNGQGYKQSARELLYYIEKDYFDVPAKADNKFPDINSAILNPTKDTLTLTFDDNQQLVYPIKTINQLYSGQKKQYSLLSSFFVDSQPIKADTVYVERNQLKFPIKEANNIKTITYLPEVWEQISVGFKFPYLTNKNGLRAFSFKDFPIELKAIINGNTGGSGTTTGNNGGSNSGNNNNSGNSNGNNNSGSNTSILPNEWEENASSALYPNPVMKGESLQIKFDAGLQQLKLYNSLGVLQPTSNIRLMEKQIETTNLEVGLYFLEIMTNNRRIIKKFVVQ